MKSRARACESRRDRRARRGRESTRADVEGVRARVRVSMSSPTRAYVHTRESGRREDGPSSSDVYMYASEACPDSCETPKTPTHLSPVRVSSRHRPFRIFLKPITYTSPFTACPGRRVKASAAKELRLHVFFRPRGSRSAPACATPSLSSLREQLLPPSDPLPPFLGGSSSTYGGPQPPPWPQSHVIHH